MRIVPASVRIESPVNGVRMLKNIEQAGRICYQSTHKVTDDSYRSFISKILKRGHLAVIEHESVTVRFVNDRGVSHEEVRHRLASYCQESTRYCNYSKERFDEEITVVDIRKFMDLRSYEVWLDAMAAAETYYFQLIKLGNKPEIARSVLPNSLKTEIVMTCNVREWRHFFTMRAAAPAHPQMREVAAPLLREFRKRIPLLFDDVGDPTCDEIVTKEK